MSQIHPLVSVHGMVGSPRVLYELAREGRHGKIWEETRPEYLDYMSSKHHILYRLPNWADEQTHRRAIRESHIRH